MGWSGDTQTGQSFLARSCKLSATFLVCYAAMYSTAAAAAYCVFVHLITT